jgi:hypothetical protein
LRGRHVVLRRLAPALALLLPVACAQPDAVDSAQLLEDVLAQHQANLAGVTGQPAPPRAAAGPSAVPVPPAAMPVASAPQAAVPALPTGPRAVPAGTPHAAGELVGQTPDTLLQLLGQPRLRREEGPAEIWHYQASDCHLDLVLYQDDGGPGLRVAHAAARAVGTARRGETACLRDIARGAGSPGMPVVTQAALGA